MTVSSWFRSDGKAVKDSIRYLYPKSSARPHMDEKSRFSQLILEHGEQHLQDWAVVAHSSPCTEQEDEYSKSSPYRRPNKIQWEQSPQLIKSRTVAATSGQEQQHWSNKRANASAAAARDKDTYPTGHMTSIQGRLHLCSRSLVFEPNDTSRAIVRCPFANMEAPPREFPTATDCGDSYESVACVEFSSKRHVSIKAQNVIAPFEPVDFVVRFRFTFLHSSPNSFVDLCHKLFVKAAQRKKHSSSIAGGEMDAALLQPMLDRPFVSDNLWHVREQVLTASLRCSWLLPLESKSGVVVVTDERLYFQPAAGVLSAPDSRATSWSVRDGNMVAVARRYHGLRDSAMEVYWKDETSTLLGFERRHEREQALRQLMLPAGQGNSNNNNNTVPCFTDRDFVCQVVHEWQKGAISNFDYLLALNAAAGRSFHDLSRYPVFPWVIADYESSKLDLTKESTFRDLTKPVGALDAKRLEYFRKRHEGMQDMGEDFLYGTHYSAPGYVLFFLVRSMPEHMLCLQNGKFDAPDRLFHSVSQCYRCVLTNHADVKELIPEFYGNDFDFLINARGLQLGATQNGDRVNDVALPPWARSARDFIKKNRKALESDICTRMLPRWIDLIFGCKSRGPAAMEALNLFHQTAYLGPTELASMQSEEERMQAELQATEFGIVPDKLFVAPHPARHDPPAEVDDLISPDLGRASSKEDSSREAWELLDVPNATNVSHDETSQVALSRSLETPEMEDAGTMNNNNIKGASAFTSQSFDRGGEYAADHSPSKTLVSRGSGHSGEAESGHHHSSPIRSQNPASPTAGFSESPQVQPLAATAGAESEWDMKVLERQQIHNDAVSACVLLLDDNEPKLSMLATTSLDGGLKIYNVQLDSSSTPTNTSGGGSVDKDHGGFTGTLSRFSYTTIMNRGHQVLAQTAAHHSKSKLTEYRSHSSRDPLASLVLATDGGGGCVAFCGGHDDVVLAYGVNTAGAVASVYSHRDAVTGLDLLARSPFDSGNALWLDNATHVMISGSWDATVKVWSASVASGETVSVNREPVAELFDADSSIACVSAKSIPTGGIVIGAGCADGSLCVWNVHSDGVQVVIHNEPARHGSGPCSVVQWVSVGGSLHMYAAFSTGRVESYTLVDGSRLIRKSAVSVGVAVLSLVYTDGVLLVGCSDGGLRLIPVRDGALFDTKPTLWNAVINKASTGISSISVAYTSQKAGGRCICCAAGEDGSVALFELKRAARANSG